MASIGGLAGDIVPKRQLAAPRGGVVERVPHCVCAERICPGMNGMESSLQHELKNETSIGRSFFQFTQRHTAGQIWGFLGFFSSLVAP
jgi:hypothetical protein